VTEARLAVDEVGGLVDKDGVGKRPARGGRPARGLVPEQQRLLLLAEDPLGGRDQHVAVAQQPQHQPYGIDRRPQLRDHLPHWRGPRHGVLRAVVWRLTDGLHPGQDRVREPLRQHRPRGAVAHVALPQLADDVGQLPGADPPPSRPDRHDERLGRGDERGVHRVLQHLGQPRVTLQGRDVGGVLAAYRHPRTDQLVEGDLPHVDLAERGQHSSDVGEECGVGADDEDATAAQPVGEGVEEVRRTVQADRGLPRPGGALDADGVGDVGADDDVLLRLDGRDDVAHRPDARTLDLGGEDPTLVARLGLVEQVLVLVRRDLAALEAEAASQRDVHRLGPGGPVEGGRHVGPPVDDDRVAAVVVDMATPDVEALGGSREVQPAEEQRRVRLVDQGEGALVQGGRQVGLGHGVATTGVEGEGLLPHACQVGAGCSEVRALGGQSPG
jgi:hypothetical protein